MRLPTLFKTPSNKTYSYQPRYYDARKERREAILNKNNTNQPSSNNLTNVRQRWKQISNKNRKSNSRFRILVILLFLMMIAWISIRSM